MFNLLSIPIVRGHNHHNHIPSRGLLHIFSAAYQKKEISSSTMENISLRIMFFYIQILSCNQSFTVFIVGILHTFGAILIENN